MLMESPPTSKTVGDLVPALFTPQSNVHRMTCQSWRRVIGAWVERSRQRHALAQLDARLLKDIGITRFEAAHEIAKPFWR